MMCAGIRKNTILCDRCRDASNCSVLPINPKCSKYGIFARINHVFGKQLIPTEQKTKMLDFFNLINNVNNKNIFIWDTLQDFEWIKISSVSIWC